MVNSLVSHLHPTPFYKDRFYLFSPVFFMLRIELIKVNFNNNIHFSFLLKTSYGMFLVILFLLGFTVE